MVAQLTFEADTAIQQALSSAAEWLMPRLKLDTPLSRNPNRDFATRLANSYTPNVVGNKLNITSSSPYYKYVRFGTAAHTIIPKRPRIPGQRPPALAFSVGGEIVFARLIHHPGTKPNPYAENTWKTLSSAIKKRIAEATKQKIKVSY